MEIVSIGLAVSALDAWWQSPLAALGLQVSQNVVLEHVFGENPSSPDHRWWLSVTPSMEASSTSFLVVDADLIT
jgi:hypothetical protein